LLSARSISRRSSPGSPPLCIMAVPERLRQRHAPARAGTPQVVVPQVADQPYWAGRVSELGIGAAHDGPIPRTGSLLAPLRTALAPETRKRAAAFAKTVRSDGTVIAARLLVAAVQGGSQ